MKKISIILAIATILTATALFAGCKNDSSSEANSSVASEATSKTTSETASEAVSEEVSEETSVAVSEEASEAVSEEASEAVSEEVSEEVSEDVSEATSEETSETAPEGYAIFKNDDISFAYPEAWVKEGTDAVIMQDNTTGNNITVVYEPLTTMYKTIDVDTLKQLMEPSLSSVGMTLSNATIEQVTNGNGVEISKMVLESSFMGINMTQTIFCVNAKNLTYSVTFTEVAESPEFLQTLFNTLKVVD